MKKEIRDGKVAVLVSPGYGAGWSTWDYENSERLLFDPSIVYMVEQMNSSEDETHRDNWISNIEEYCKENYDHVYTGGVEDLRVVWLPIGTQFRIDEYDGSETIEIKEEMDWVTA